MKIRVYKVDVNTKKVKEYDVEEHELEDQEKWARMKAMAEASPGSIVAGWKVENEDNVTADDEKYLDELSNSGDNGGSVPV